MMKRIIYRATLLSFAVIVSLASLLFAQQPPPAEPPPNNTFTMTTYYPAPFGAYDTIQANKVGIGTTKPEAKLHIVDNDGRYLLYVGSGVDYKSVLGIFASSRAFPSAGSFLVGSEWSINGALWATPMIYRSLRYPDSGGGVFPDNEYGELMIQGTSFGNGYNRGISFVTSPSDAVGPSIMMRITKDGNVGIGTTSPSEKLHLVGDLRLENPNVGDLYLQNGSATDSRIFTSAGKKLLIGANGFAQPGAVSLALDTTGNVGIGTTSPNAPLDVFKSDSSATNNPGNPAIRVTAISGANNKFLSLGYDATLNKGYIQAAQAGVAWEDLLLNPNGGNVGIGTSSPNPLGAAGGGLSVEGIAAGTNANLETIGNNVDSANPIGRLAFTHHYGSTYVRVGALEAIRAGADDAADLRVRLRPAGFLPLTSSPPEVFRITSSGNVGIGTTTPQGLLHLNSDGDTVLRVESTSVTDAQIPRLWAYAPAGSADPRVFQLRGHSGGIYKGGLNINKNGSVLLFNDSSVGITVASGSSGSVGIGTTAPQSALQVVGNYIQIPHSSGTPPPAADCSSTAHAGRMYILGSSLYICPDNGSGWVIK